MPELPERYVSRAGQRLPARRAGLLVVDTRRALLYFPDAPHPRWAVPRGTCSPTFSARAPTGPTALTRARRTQRTVQRARRGRQAARASADAARKPPGMAVVVVILAGIGAGLKSDVRGMLAPFTTPTSSWPPAGAAIA
jgi:hypothetical protein